MMLVYHNITPPEYFLGVHEQLVRQCYHGRRELLPYRSRCDLALGDSEFNRQELEALGFRADRRAAGRPGLHAPRRRAATRASLDAYDDEWTNILFVGRLIPNKRPDDLIRFFHAYKTRLQPARPADPRRRRTAGSRRIWRSCTRSIAALGVQRRAHPRPGHQRGADGALRRRRSVPLRQRARRVLRAARSRRSTSACRCSRYAATAVPATMDGGGDALRHARSRAGSRR